MGKVSIGFSLFRSYYSLSLSYSIHDQISYAIKVSYLN